MATDLNIIVRDQKDGSRVANMAALPGSDRDYEVPPRLPISTRIAVRVARKILFVDSAEIVAIEARANYVVLRQKKGKIVIRQTISEIAEKLRSFGFVRIHRSTIVNSMFAREVQSLCDGDYLLRLEGGAEYTVTRKFKNNLRLLAPLWLSHYSRCDI